MEYVIYHDEEKNWKDYYISVFLSSVIKRLKRKYPKDTFKVIKDKSRYDQGLGGQCSVQNLCVINPSTEKYVVVSFFDDWKHHFMQHLGWKPDKMVKFFYAGGFNFYDYYNWKYEHRYQDDIVCPNNISEIYQPFYYNTYQPGHLDYIDKLYESRTDKEIVDKIIFRGWLWPFRKHMLKDIDDDSVVIIEKREKGNLLNYRAYLEEMSSYKCSLSLPGGTEICNRDIESFAVGTPVIRPLLGVNYEDPLIPNYHYINCFHNCPYWNGHPEYLDPASFSKYFLQTWRRVRYDQDYLRFISKNARDWYLKHCTLQKNLDYLLPMIKLEDLDG